MDRIFSSVSRRVHARDDRGIALVVTIALMGLVGALMIVLVTVAIRENSASGRDRQRSVGVMTAEGQIDSLIAQIQSAPPASLPCGPLPAVNVTVKSDKMSVANTVVYSNAAGTPVDCSLVATTEVATAKITSRSTSSALADQAPAVRKVETLVRLTPTYANALNRAIFSNADLTFANSSKIYGKDGAQDADVYSNGSMTCNNNVEFHGSIYAQGSVTMANTCVVSVDVQAKTGYTGNNPGANVLGKILVSNGNIVLNQSKVGQQARASGTVTGDPCSTAGKCFGAQTVAAPPMQAFPEYVWNETTKSAWVAQGYTVVNLPNSTYPCGNYGGSGPLNGKVDGVAHWIYDNQATMGKTVIYANCPSDPVKFQGINISLNADLAIFAKGGFNFSSLTTIASNSSTHRLLYMIQPYDAVTTHPCTTDGISLDNQVTIADTIDDLLYSPCSIRKANNTTHYGQIYAGGQVKIDNSLTMYYKPLPVFGLVTSGSPVEKYSVDILYKRETSS